MKSDIVIVGGGFFGCALAIHEATKNPNNKIVLLEKYDELLTGAALINQARIHSGFHYPRSLETLTSCLENYKKFIMDYENCIDKTFKNYYAIAKEGSKVSADDYYKIYTDHGAPISQTPPDDPIMKLINKDRICEVFNVEEYAFNASKLRGILKKKLQYKRNILVYKNCSVSRITENVAESTLGKFEADKIYLCTYSQNNDILLSSGLKPLNLKYQHVELCKIATSSLLSNTAFTLMDGPFFSLYPYPAKNCHTLAHVTHTVRKETNNSAQQFHPKVSNIHKMLRSAAEYVPEVQKCTYLGSLYSKKAILPKNKLDDGRPILFKQQEDNKHVFNIIGGKIDNIYDLFNILDNQKGTNVVFEETL